MFFNLIKKVNGTKIYFNYYNFEIKLQDVLKWCEYHKAFILK